MPGMAPPSDGSAPVVTNVPQTGPVVPPIHNLELAAARTPTGRVNGKVSNADFLPEIVRVDAVGPVQVLRFVQGEPASPDREIMIYLRLKTGEKLAGQKIEVTSDLRTRGLPQVVKRWKTNPRYAPNSRSFSSGYAMRLEFVSHKDGVVKGRIFLSMPDTEKSVIAGNFSAMTTIPAEGIAAPTAVPGQAPGAPGAPGMSPGMPGMPPEAMNPEYQRRYGPGR